MKIVGSKNGKIAMYEIEMPLSKKDYLKIQTHYSAISPGTELSMGENSGKDLIELGYSASGIVIDCDEKTSGFKNGDIVAVYGAPYVGHKEYLMVPKTLCAKVPANLSIKDAALAGLGAIAIHALRQAQLQFGETIIVVGLGIYGQLISQIGKAAGYRVLPINLTKERSILLETVSGIKSYHDELEMEKRLYEITDGKGADAVFLCAGSDDGTLTNKSMKWLRDRGTSVIVGNVEVNYNRQMMFAKEIKILISRAGGPGRYDSVYEKEAIDYPYGYVRWTEGRNVKEFVRLLEDNLIKVEEYYDKPYLVDECRKAYKSLNTKDAIFLTQLIYYKE